MARVSTSLRHELASGAQALLAAEARADPLLYAVALMILTSVWRVQDLVPIFGLIELSLLAMALAVALFALDRHPARALGELKSPILAFALALAAVAVLGIPMSLWPRSSTMAFVQELVPNLLLMVLLAASVRGMRDLEWLALVMLLGAALYSLFALLRFGVDQSGRFGDLVYYDANDLALVLLCAMPFALHFLIGRGWRRRLFGGATLALLAVTFVGTGSRGGFLGLVALLAFVLVGYRAIPRRLRVLTVAGGFGLFALVAGDAYWANIRTLTQLEEDYNWSGRAAEGRMEVWRRGVSYMADHPVVGVGLRNFPLAEGMLSEESRARAERGRGFKWSAAHNSYLEAGAELGVTGLLAFGGMLIAAFHVLRRIRRAPASMDAPTAGLVAMACALSASFVAYCVAGVFVSAAYFSLLYVLFGLTMGLVKIQRLDPEAFGWPGWTSIIESAHYPPPPARERVPSR